MKTCAKCHATKPLTEFHKHPSGSDGRHSWCKPCANAAQKLSREKNGRPERKRKWTLSSRYGITESDFDAMLERQDSLCGICHKSMKRVCIDHDHKTYKVRGLLCHGCNIALGHVEKVGFLPAALAYLDLHKEVACVS